MAAPVPAEEIRQSIFNDHWCSRDAENASLALFERASPLVEGFDFSQQAATMPKQTFALRGEFEAPADPVEQGQVESGFERVDLSRRRRLTQMQSRDGPVDAARLHNSHEGA